MIQKIKGFVFVLVIFFIFITLISLFIPSTISNASAVVMNAPQEKIFAALKDTANWSQLNLSTDITEKPMEINKAQTIQFSSTTFHTSDTKNMVSILPIMENEIGHQVQWHSEIKIRWYPWEKLRGLFLEKTIGQIYTQTLEGIKKKVEANPEG